ncbi:uncharacterized protein QC764_710915 [Podospora pseudoanserina]|uniref:BRCT domain-containing protein n=1 Tax=Podospora pseudoanserina TaxID=2609844 RepID=A0ABR0HL68_9PEZI|nr:hypothetical protein QC764_710915 [Podospora pseudoanserina]
MPRGIRFKVKDLTFKEKGMFAKFTIAVCGSFKNNPNTHWNDTNLHRWITLRGGRYHKGTTITRDVTHFVTDEDELRSRSPRAVEALRNKRIQIVPLEWLEFSMINRKVLQAVKGGEYDLREGVRREGERVRRERRVEMGRVLGERAVNTNLYRVYTDGTFYRYEVELFRESNAVQGPTPETTPVKLQLPALSKGVSDLDSEVETKAEMGSENQTPTEKEPGFSFHHHVVVFEDGPELDAQPKYRTPMDLQLAYHQLPTLTTVTPEFQDEVDPKDVEMDIEAEPETPTKTTRVDRGEKYTLTLYESLAQPPLYFFCAKYSKSSTDTFPKYYRPSETPQLFWTEYTHFIEFFHKKTGVEWRKRLLFCGEGKSGAGSKRKGKGKEEDNGEAGEGEGVEKGWFTYSPPGGGKPVGWVPEEYIPKEKEGEVERSGGPYGRE